MATDNNIRVINEEYERVLGNPDNMIMSEGLRELMDGAAGQRQTPLSSADSHALFISGIDDVMDMVELPGTLHTIRQLNDKMILSFEVTNITQDVLKRLHGSMSNDEEINIKLNGIKNLNESSKVKE